MLFCSKRQFNHFSIHFSNSVAKSPESYTIKAVIESTYIDS